MKDFQVLSKIGDGAYSEVYKVRRISDMGVYALKKVRLFINLFSTGQNGQIIFQRKGKRLKRGENSCIYTVSYALLINF